MANLSAAERIKMAAVLKEPDQVPVMVGAVAPFIMCFTGLTPQEYYFHPEKCLGAITAFQRRFPEILLKGGFKTTYRNEPFLSGLGFKLDWVGGFPKVDRTSMSVDAIKVPDPFKEGLMPRVLAEMQYFVAHADSELKARYGDLLWVVNGPGPLGGIGDLVGYSPLFAVMYEEPQRLHHLLEVFTQGAEVWIRAQEKAYREAGVKAGMGFVVDEALPMVSPALLREFFVPYIRRIFAAMTAEVKIFHCDNDVTHIPEIIAEMGANVYDFNFSSIELLKRQLAGKICLMGNVPAIETLQDGTPAKVMESCRRIINSAGPRGGFILASAGAITPATPLENLDAMVAAAEQYGRYPIKAEPYIPRRVEIPEKRVERLIAQERALDLSSVLDRLSKSVMEGNPAEARALAEEALASGTSPEVLLAQGLARGLKLASEKNYLKLAFLPELTMATRAFQAGLATLEGHGPTKETVGKVVIGAVQGNLMESGVNIIAAMLTANGFTVYNLGADVPAQKFIETAKKESADIIALGVYTSDRLGIVAQVAELIKKDQLPFKLLVGGKGISPAKAKELGAHAFAKDAYQAVDAAKGLVSKKGRR